MPPKLSYGLNLPSKNTPAGQKRKKPIFGDDSDDEPSNEPETDISRVSQPTTKPKLSAQLPRKPGMGVQKPNIKPLNKNNIFADNSDEEEDEPELQYGMNKNTNTTSNTTSTSNPSKEYTNLSALHSSKKHAQEAQHLDPSIYSYDSVYDSLHTKPETKSNQQSHQGPRYMTSLLRSAEVRKRDQLRAKDRMLAKEREAEGDEFADKEKFVTSAYKAQQEEMRRVEAEEEAKEREEEERRKRNGGVGGMVGFYRDVLSRGEKKHEEAMKAAEEMAERVKRGEKVEDDDKQEKTESQVAEELNAHGARIAVNDEGQVVDKRQLLSAGLNVAPKPKGQTAEKPKADPRQPAKPRFDAAYHANRAGQRARQTEMIAAQLEEQAKKEEEAEEARQKEISERSRSRRSEKDVSSAKERYLARKREREAANKET